MKLRIFQSNHGDCLLLQGESAGTILCDGGAVKTMKSDVSAELSMLEGIDLIYVSHIDDDHIAGIKQLLSDALDWKVFDFHEANGTSIRTPRSPRPPQIGGIWHNAFTAQVGENSGRIEDRLAAAAPMLANSGVRDIDFLGFQFANIATGVASALQVSRFVRPDLLDIPLNVLPGSSGPSKLIMAREGQDPVRIGSLTLSVIGPTAGALKDLRDGWNNWLEDPDNADSLERLNRRIADRLNRLGNGQFDQNPFDLRDWEGIPGFKGVTVPNIASLMLLVEENGKRLLMTGDSQQDVIIEALKTADLIRNGGVHFDVLKVPHHGSENNADKKFCRTVSADHYVFCGNGMHENPDLGVIDLYVKSRLGPASRRARAPEADGRPFTFWFSTTSDRQNGKSREHFEKLEEKVRRIANHSGGQLRLKFNTSHSITVEP